MKGRLSGDRGEIGARLHLRRVEVRQLVAVEARHQRAQRVLLDQRVLRAAEVELVAAGEELVPEGDCGRLRGD